MPDKRGGPTPPAALKLVRALAHLKALDDAMKAWVKGGAYELAREIEREGEREVWTFFLERRQPMPAEWPLLIGEFLYTVHSALDHLAYQLAALRSHPADPEPVTFPIFKQKREFWKPGDKKKGEKWRKNSGAWRLERLPEDTHDMFLDVQPYQRGGDSPKHPLWLLHELSNHDKHQALHVVAVAVAEQRHEVLQLEHAELESVVPTLGPLNDRTRVGYADFKVPSDAPTHARRALKVGFRAEPAFAETGPAPGRGVIPVLSEILSYVSDDVFDARFGPYLWAAR